MFDGFRVVLRRLGVGMASLAVAGGGVAVETVLLPLFAGALLLVCLSVLVVPVGGGMMSP